MHEKQLHSRLTRRSLLKQASLAAGAMAIGPMMPGLESNVSIVPGGLSAARRATGEPLRIGVLVPRSQIYAGLGESLLLGLEYGFAERDGAIANRPVSLHPVETDGGMAQARAMAQALAEADVSLVVAMATPLVARHLRTILEPAGISLVVTQVGANVVSEGDELPGCAHHSLSYWQANWATGAWAPASLGKRAFLAMSLYESGYDTPYAVEHGLLTGGGRLVGRAVSHISPTTDFSSLMAEIRTANPDFVYALYSGREAVQFVRAYDQAGFSGRIPLLGSAFSVDESLLADHGAGALGIRSAFAWAPDAASDFASGFHASTGKQANALALLGYGTARRIAHAGEAVFGTLSGRRFDEALAASCPVTPLYLREVQQVGGMLGHVSLLKLDASEALGKTTLLERDALRSGWISPYLA